MNLLRNKIESIITGPRQAPIISFAAVLYLLSCGYGGLQRLRAACYRQHLIASKKLPCKVISVGNITVGGTGKTPMTIFMAKRLKRFGYRVAVISRGDIKALLRKRSLSSVMVKPFVQGLRQPGTSRICWPVGLRAFRWLSVKTDFLPVWWLWIHFSLKSLSSTTVFSICGWRGMSIWFCWTITNPSETGICCQGVPCGNR